VEEREGLMGLRRFVEGEWEWFEPEDLSGKASPPKGAHLFFSGNRTSLQEIAHREILSQGALSARLSARPQSEGGIHVLELFHRLGESGEAMLAVRHEKCEGLRYAGWRGDACSMEELFRKMCMNKRDLGM